MDKEQRESINFVFEIYQKFRTKYESCFLVFCFDGKYFCFNTEAKIIKTDIGLTNFVNYTNIQLYL